MYLCTVEEGGKGGEKLWNSVNASIYMQTLYHFDFFQVHVIIHYS